MRIPICSVLSNCVKHFNGTEVKYSHHVFNRVARKAN